MRFLVPPFSSFYVLFLLLFMFMRGAWEGEWVGPPPGGAVDFGSW